MNAPRERDEKARRSLDEALDEALDESFPASDPVSIVTSENEEDWGEERPEPARPGSRAPATPAKEPSAPASNPPGSRS
jgi:hypothetical protein